MELLTALGSADIVAGVATCWARRGAGVAGRGGVGRRPGRRPHQPGAAAWFAAGHRSTEPAQMLALAKLGLEPLLDLGMRLGGAAVP